MKPITPIEYNKFRCDVYSPDEVLLQTARVNSDGLFFSSGLVPGQEYLVVFSYDGIFLMAASFLCDASGKVVYLSPAHFLFNNGVSNYTFKAGSELAKIVKKSAEYNIPPMRWEKLLYEKAHFPVNVSDKPPIKPIKVVKFKAGSDLASKVK